MIIVCFVYYTHAPDRLVEPVVEDDTYVEYDVVEGGHVVGVLDEVVCVL